MQVRILSRSPFLDWIMQFYGSYETYAETKVVVDRLIADPLVNRVEVVDEPSDLRYKVMVEWRTIGSEMKLDVTAFGDEVHKYR